MAKHIKVTFVNSGTGFVDGSKIVAAVPLTEDITRLYMDSPGEVPDTDILTFEVYDSALEVLRSIDECERYNLSRR